MKLLNADKVRMATDRQLAEIVMCPYEVMEMEKHCHFEGNKRRCEECTYDWLRKPVSNEPVNSFVKIIPGDVLEFYDTKEIVVVIRVMMESGYAVVMHSNWQQNLLLIDGINEVTKKIAHVPHFDDGIKCLVNLCGK